MTDDESQEAMSKALLIDMSLAQLQSGTLSLWEAYELAWLSSAKYHTIVSEVSGSGRILIYIQAIGVDEKPGGQAYYLATHEEISSVIGQAYWVIGEE